MALALYGLVAAVALGRWIAGVAAIATAILLVRRHPRARFAAYILLTLVALRAALTATWPALAFAVAAIGVLQLPAAGRAWPRLKPGLPRRPPRPET